MSGPERTPEAARARHAERILAESLAASVIPTEGKWAATLGRVGHIGEWHLDFHNTFCHEEFHFGTWLHQPAEVIAAVFLDAGFEAVRPIRHSMLGNRIE